MHLYQARKLPALDDDGLLDPYFKVYVDHVKEKSDVKVKTTAPKWYQTLSLDVALPQNLKLAPQVVLQLWDKDLVVDDYCAEYRHDMADITPIPYDPVRAPW